MSILSFCFGSWSTYHSPGTLNIWGFTQNKAQAVFQMYIPGAGVRNTNVVELQTHQGHWEISRHTETKQKWQGWSIPNGLLMQNHRRRKKWKYIHVIWWQVMAKFSVCIRDIQILRNKSVYLQNIKKLNVEQQKHQEVGKGPAGGQDDSQGRTGKKQKYLQKCQDESHYFICWF